MTSLKVNPYKKYSIARIYGNTQPNHFRSGTIGQSRNQKKVTALYEKGHGARLGQDDDDDGIVAGFPQPLSQPRSNPFDAHQPAEGEEEVDEEGEAEGDESNEAIGSEEEGLNENEQGDNELNEDSGRSTVIYMGRYNHIPIIRWSPNLVLNRRGRIGSVDDDDEDESDDEDSNADSESEPIDNSSDYASGNVEELDVSRKKGQNKSNSRLSRSTTCPAILPASSSRTPNSTQCVPSRPSSKLKAGDATSDGNEAEEGGGEQADSDHKRARKCRLPGKQFHMVYTMPRHDCGLVRTVFEVHGFRNHSNKEIARLGCGSEYDPERELSPAALAFNVLWTGTHIRPALYRSLRDYQRVNHFPHSFEITRKDKMYRNIHAMQLIKGAKQFDFVPPTFIMPGTCSILRLRSSLVLHLHMHMKGFGCTFAGEYEEFCQAYVKERGLYIVKPCALSRGRGIFLVNSPDQVPLDESHIVSKYISNPVSFAPTDICLLYLY